MNLYVLGCSRYDCDSDDAKRCRARGKRNEGSVDSYLAVHLLLMVIDMHREEACLYIVLDVLYRVVVLVWGFML